MTLRQKLIAVASAYCSATGTSRSRVSTVVLSGGAKLDAIAAGNADLNTASFERAMAWFSANWPDGACWPEGVDRPVPDTRGAA